MTVKEVIEQYKDRYDFAVEGEDTDGEYWLECGNCWHNWSMEDWCNYEEFLDREVVNLDFTAYTEEKTILITIK